jgi:hypothetical protein
VACAEATALLRPPARRRGGAGVARATARAAHALEARQACGVTSKYKCRFLLLVIRAVTHFVKSERKVTDARKRRGGPPLGVLFWSAPVLVVETLSRL